MKFLMTNTGLQLEKDISTPFDLINNYLVDPVKNKVQEVSQEFFEEVMMGFLIALKNIVVDTIGMVALIGCGLCILFKIAGWEDGYKWAGVLFVANILVKLLLGG